MNGKDSNRFETTNLNIFLFAYRSVLKLFPLEHFIAWIGNYIWFKCFWMHMHNGSGSGKKRTWLDMEKQNGWSAFTNNERNAPVKCETKHFIISSKSKGTFCSLREKLAQRLIVQTFAEISTRLKNLVN